MLSVRIRMISWYQHEIHVLAWYQHYCCLEYDLNFTAFYATKVFGTWKIGFKINVQSETEGEKRCSQKKYKK